MPRKIELDNSRKSGHWYKVEGIDRLVPSVSTVIGNVLAKPALVPWATKTALARVENELRSRKGKRSITDKWITEVIEASRKEPKRVAEEAADIGTRAHHAIHCELTGKFWEDDSPQVKRAVESFFVWRKQTNLDITLSEKTIFSENLMVAGTMDSFARKNGRAVIVDYKTSRAIWPDMAFQVGGYGQCWEDEHEEPVNDGWIVRFPKEPDDPIPFEAKKIDMKWGKKGFIHCKRLFDIKKEELFLEG